VVPLHYLASVWMERLELPTPAPRAGALPLRHIQSVLVPEARISGLRPERLFEAGVFRNSVLTVGFEPTLAAV
jgi:hypothetical protein